MGSLVYAKACRANGDRVTAMLSLETMGYFDDRDGSQQYPFPFGLFYPSTGDFIAFVGNFSSRSQVRRATQVFRETTAFPAEGAALPVNYLTRMCKFSRISFRMRTMRWI